MLKNQKSPFGGGARTCYHVGILVSCANIENDWILDHFFYYITY